MPRLLTFKELRDAGVPFGRRHLYTLEESGEFPKRIKVGSSRVAWNADEIRKWVNSKVEARK